MEATLTPMQRAYRKFLSGRPPATPANTPLAAVNLATEQRARLEKFLQASDGFSTVPQVTSTAVVVRYASTEPTDALANAIPVRAGDEGVALQTLQTTSTLTGGFVIVGLLFGVRIDEGVQPVAYPIERTDTGLAALRYSLERQNSSAVRHASN